jgi:hypothetical protein
MTTQTYPALYLTPVQAGADGVCTLRRVTLVPGGEPVVVGRIMGFTGDLLPGAHNLYFGSGTLSRKHSEVYLTADNEVCRAALLFVYEHATDCVLTVHGSRHGQRERHVRQRPPAERGEGDVRTSCPQDR